MHLFSVKTTYLVANDRGAIKDGRQGKTRFFYKNRDGAKSALLYEAKLPKYKVYYIPKLSNDTF